MDRFPRDSFRHTGLMLAMTLLAVTLCVSVTCVTDTSSAEGSPGVAVEGTPIGNLRYVFDVDNGEVTVTGHTVPEVEVTIPAKVIVNSGAVEIYAEGPSGYVLMDTVMMSTADLTQGEYIVVAVGDRAFVRNTVQSVTFPSSIRSIGDYAFKDCRYLKVFTLPENAECTIGVSAFHRCYTLVEADLRGATYVGDDAFFACHCMITVTLGQGLTGIGVASFGRCLNLVEVYNLSSVPDIKPGYMRSPGHVSQWATAVHTDISEDSIIVREGDFCFVNLGDGCELIGYLGYNVDDLVIPAHHHVGDTGDEERPYFIHDYVFCNRNYKTVTFEEGAIVTSIGSYAFAQCSRLESIELPSTLTSIGTFAFNGCVSLKSLTIPGSVEVLNTRTVSNCDSLTTLVLSEGMVALEFGSIYTCPSLTTLTIPNSMAALSVQSICDCESLREVTLGYNLSEIRNVQTIPGTNLFDNCPKLTKVYDHSLRGMGAMFADVHDLLSDVEYYTATIDGVTYNYYDLDRTAVITSVDTDVLPSVLSLGSVIIDSKRYVICAIPPYMFSHCPITELLLEDSVEYIGPFAFDGCDKLRIADVPVHTYIGDNAFRGCRISTVQALVDADDDVAGVITELKTEFPGANVKVKLVGNGAEIPASFIDSLEALGQDLLITSSQLELTIRSPQFQSIKGSGLSFNVGDFTIVYEGKVMRYTYDVQQTGLGSLDSYDLSMDLTVGSSLTYDIDIFVVSNGVATPVKYTYADGMASFKASGDIDSIMITMAPQKIGGSNMIMMIIASVIAIGVLAASVVYKFGGKKQ